LTGAHGEAVVVRAFVGQVWASAAAEQRYIGGCTGLPLGERRGEHLAPERLEEHVGHTHLEAPLRVLLCAVLSRFSITHARRDSMATITI
jgi:hypothetical protein